ncbi:nicotinamide riboside transporter PnuC [Sphingomonas bacterium]|uniref:nicotinamide riboside transporter PnuC n=1 Tax=Sphingomonas bacterium TaxID=1895847 RepID=UPI0015754EAC|nr:nicotinamide riboside transporter PnuC [Sphingomonas bacterium]
MSRIEWIAAGLGVLCVALLVRRSLWNYPFAIASVVLLGWVFLAARLYSDALLQVFYVAINLYGWSSWSRSRATAGRVMVEPMSVRALLGWSVAGVGATIGWGAIMRGYTDASYPWWDAAVAVPSIVAQLLLARRQIENWAVWIAVDCVAVPLYVTKGLWAAAGLYVIYLALSVWGWIDWRRATRPPHAGPMAA